MNPMDEVTVPELLKLLGEKEAELYRYRRNEQILIAKLNEATAKEVKPPKEKKK